MNPFASLVNAIAEELQTREVSAHVTMSSVCGFRINLRRMDDGIEIGNVWDTQRPRERRFVCHRLLNRESHLIEAENAEIHADPEEWEALEKLCNLAYKVGSGWKSSAP